MKICSLYGVGYYYIPGTDTCIKIGGYVRYEAYHNQPSALFPNNTNAGVFTRNVNTFAQQARFRLTTDVRTQTEYGTLRSYFSFGFNWLNNANEPLGSATPGTGNFALALERAFIQFAGFTIGRADTFFAFYNGAAYGLVPIFFDGSSGPSGLNVFAYTWQFGNGLSASLSAEDSFARGAPVVDLQQTLSAPAFFGGVDDRQGQQIPDIVANLRVDQAWGSAQIMGSLHQVGGRYYSNTSFPNSTLDTCAGTNANTTVCANPGEKWGWAVGGGLTLKMPWDAKDTLSGVIAYAKGNSRAVGFGMGNNFLHKDGIAFGLASDGVYLNPNNGFPGYDGSIQLTTTWGGTVAFEHYWTPSLRTSWVFGYYGVEYNGNTKTILANSGACNTGDLKKTSCDPDWSTWKISSRTMWNPVANLDVGLEVAYSKVNTSFAGQAFLGNTGQGLANGVYNVEDQSAWTATLRVQRSFWP